MVVDALAERAGARLRRAAGPYWTCEIELAATPVLLAKPTTYMNRSGVAARLLLRNHELEPERLLVLLDDIYLPFGKLRLRPGGSSGGHNGLASIEAVLQTRGVPRLRLGVGAPEGAEDLSDHVLQDFEPHELEALPEVLERAVTAVDLVAELGVAGARPRVNASPPPA
jgi:PTH1 family peptidyl-tRNA hydrolase